MKKQITILLVIILALCMSLGLTGCDQPAVSVSSQLRIDENFSGTRTVAAIYPLSTDIDALKDKIIADNPTAEIDGADFRYIGVEDDGYHFELQLTFSDKSKYEGIISALVGRNADVFLSRKNTYLTQGTRMAENFDVSELIGWIISDTAACDEAKNLIFIYDSNTVEIGADSYETSSTVSINECTGSAVNAIAVKTSNDKEGFYDRTFTFTVPNNTYNVDRNAIEQYFAANTLPDAKYSGWSSEGSNMVYTVIYEDLSIEKMAEVTSEILDTDSTAIFYGDRDNASTPLSEGLTFEENIDAFSFIGPENGFPTLYYSYSLPQSTIYGEGAVFEDGRWVSAGTWTDDVYTVELKNGSAKLRIPDGIQYTVSGINFSLASLGDSRFHRSTDFLYPKSGGKAAVDYAVDYFNGKGMESEVSETEKDYVCHVSFEGNTEEITAGLVKVFGSGNFMAYEQRRGMFDLSIKTVLTDYVNLGYMLNSENAACPMTYSVSSEGGENIVSVSVDGSETAYTEQSRSSLPIQAGCATVQYRGNIPVVSRIMVYVTVGAILLVLTTVVCILLMKPKRRRRAADPLHHPDAVYENEDTPEEDVAEELPEKAEDSPQKSTPLSQTTTFSIFELNALVRNKKYVDEINKDIEERMHAQSLEEQKNDIRARELEEMSRKVYGDSVAEVSQSDSEEQTDANTDTEQSEDKSDD